MSSLSLLITASFLATPSRLISASCALIFADSSSESEN
jgi:hypothetical protein